MSAPACIFVALIYTIPTYIIFESTVSYTMRGKPKSLGRVRSLGPRSKLPCALDTEKVGRRSCNGPGSCATVNPLTTKLVNDHIKLYVAKPATNGDTNSSVAVTS